MTYEGENELVAELRDMGTRRLVRWLATPASSGIYLSVDDIRRLGARLGVGVSPFSRASGLEQLLRGATLDGRLEEALALLGEEMAAHVDAYRVLALPALAGWIERGSRTVDAWATLSATFSDAGESET